MPTNLPTYTAATFLATYEPHTVALMAAESDLSADTQRAHAVATAAGLPVNAGGEYPAIVWFSVYP